MLLLRLETCSLVLPHLIDALQLLLLNLGFLLLHVLVHVIRRSILSHHLVRQACMLLLLRNLRLYQIHLRTKLCSLFQRSVLIRSTYVLVSINVLKLLLIHKCLLHLLSLVFTWHRA